MYNWWGGTDGTKKYRNQNIWYPLIDYIEITDWYLFPFFLLYRDMRYFYRETYASLNLSIFLHSLSRCEKHQSPGREEWRLPRHLQRRSPWFIVCWRKWDILRIQSFIGPKNTEQKSLIAKKPQCIKNIINFVSFEQISNLLEDGWFTGCKYRWENIFQHRAVQVLHSQAWEVLQTAFMVGWMPQEGHQEARPLAR